MAPAKKTVAQALALLEGKSGLRSVPMLEHGTLLVKLYAPRGDDPQTPHTRDEVYVVAHGSGIFVRDGERIDFGTGDLLFVPAGVPHRFEAFSEDLALWVIFYGPEGGEQQSG